MKIRDLPNLGPASERMLAVARIETVEALEALGAVEAYARVCSAGVGASLNLLYAIEGALTQRHWTAVRRQSGADLLFALEAREEIRSTAGSSSSGV